MILRRLPNAPVADLEWVETGSSGKRYELRGEGSCFAALEFRGRGRSAAGASTPDATWGFSRRGWWTSRVLIHEGEGDRLLGRMALGGARFGILETGDGTGELTSLRWSEWRTWDSPEDWVIRYHNTSGFNTLGARVEVAPVVSTLAELPLLIALGWYLTVLAYASD